jgi:hypothetical protein
MRDLERRVRELEDVIQIYRLMASYGPSVDSDSKTAASGLWTEDGVYDVDVAAWSGRPEIEGMLAGDAHQGYLRNGCSHQVAMPRVTLDGDKATATTYMSLIERDGEAHTIRRQTANRWDLVRTPEGWRVKVRTNRLLDGRADARELLRRGITDQGE